MGTLGAVSGGTGGSAGWSLRADTRGFSFRIGDAADAHNARRIFVTYLASQASAGSDCSAAELIFGELLGNVTRHAPGAVDVRLRWNGPLAVLEITDDGPGYDTADVHLPDMDAESARGLFIVRGFGGDDLRTYRNADGRNVTHVVLPVRRGGGR